VLKINKNNKKIMRKVFPNAFAEGIEGVGLHPVRVNVAYAILTNK
jgi:hypothetical protein